MRPTWRKIYHANGTSTVQSSEGLIRMFSINPPAEEPLNFDRMLQKFYAIKKAREKMPPTEIDCMILCRSPKEARAMRNKLIRIMIHYGKRFGPFKDILHPKKRKKK